MRAFCTIALCHVVLTAGCSASTSQTEDTTPETTAASDATGSTEAPAGDDTHQRALEAAQAFGEALGPILSTVPDDRAFEACERSNELIARANALNEVGVPAGVSDADAYREELARLPAAVTMMATYCGRGVETVPANLWVSAELTFYRLLFLLEPTLAPTSEAGPNESSHVAAARAVLAALAPVVSAHREDRSRVLCEQLDPLVASVERLAGEGTPSDTPAARNYTEESERLTSEANAASTQCGEGSESMSSDLSVTIEVAADRLWLMLHRRWPGAS